MMKISAALLIAALSSTGKLLRVSAQQEVSFLRGDHGSHYSEALDEGDEDATPKKELRCSYAVVRLGGSGAGQAGGHTCIRLIGGSFLAQCFTDSACCSRDCNRLGVCVRGTKARGDSCVHSDECAEDIGCTDRLCGGRQPTTPEESCKGAGSFCRDGSECCSNNCGAYGPRNACRAQPTTPASPDRPPTNFRVPYPGYCLDTQGRMYSAIYAPTSTNNIHNHEGGPVEGCASWCLYFRDPGLVGFMITTRVDGSTNYCACHYSADTLPINPRTSVDHSSQTNTGRGPVASGDGTANVSCYPVEVYDGPDNSDQE